MELALIPYIIMGGMCYEEFVDRMMERYRTIDSVVGYFTFCVICFLFWPVFYVCFPDVYGKLYDHTFPIFSILALMLYVSVIVMIKSGWA